MNLPVSFVCITFVMWGCLLSGNVFVESQEVLGTIKTTTEVNKRVMRRHKSSRSMSRRYSEIMPKIWHAESGCEVGRYYDWDMQDCRSCDRICNLENNNLKMCELHCPGTFIEKTVLSDAKNSMAFYLIITAITLFVLFAIPISICIVLFIKLKQTKKRDRSRKFGSIYKPNSMRGQKNWSPAPPRKGPRVYCPPTYESSSSADRFDATISLTSLNA